ncbi:hypothetical protein N0V85_002806, partial [Neurospora sp. IMI 360204]
MSTPQDTQDTQDTAMSQSIANLCNSANALAEVLTRVGNRVSETSQVDEALMISLVYLENIKGQFINLVASAQEAVSQKQATKLAIEQVTKKLEQIQEMLEHSSKDTMDQIKEQMELTFKDMAEKVEKQLELTSNAMSDDSKKMAEKCVNALALTGEAMVDQVEKLEHTSEETKKMSEQAKEEIKKMAENANKTIINSSESMVDQIYNLEYDADEIQVDVREVKEQCKEVLGQSKEVMVLTMEELKLAKEDMQRERLLFKDQHDRLEQMIEEMYRVLEGRDAENKGLKALYSKLSSHALRSVQNATNFRDAQYKFLVDGFARFEQKIAFITHHIGSTSAISGKASTAVTTKDACKADRTGKDSKIKPEDKIAELQKTIRDLKYECDVLTGSKKVLELRLAKFEQDALAASPTAPEQPVPDTPCPTLKSTKSKRSLTETGEPLAQLTLSDSETTAVASTRPSVESLIQPDLWERLIAPALLSDEIKRRLRLIKPQVTGGLRLETLFLRVVNIAVHDQAWENFDSFLKQATISQWYCVDGLVKNGLGRGSIILVGHQCDG